MDMYNKDSGQVQFVLTQNVLFSVLWRDTHEIFIFCLTKNDQKNNNNNKADLKYLSCNNILAHKK